MNLKKNLNDVYRFIEKDITEACKGIISPKKLASALIKSNLKSTRNKTGAFVLKQ